MYNYTNAHYDVQISKRKGTSVLMSSVTLLLIAGISLLTGCKKKDDSTEPATTAVNFRMTDAPGDYDAVYIDLIGAEVHSDVKGWVPLNVKAGIYNLANLTNGKDTLIANGQVAVGNVSEIRLILGNNNTVVVKGVSYALSTPSAQQSGLKLKVNTVLVEGITYNLLIDFDADKSIVDTGNDKYILKPVLRVITTAISGAISGTALPLLAQPAVYAIIGTDSFSTYANPLTGNYFIGGLAAGTYKVVFMPKGIYTDTTIAGVTVTTGAITSMGTVTIK